LMAIGMGEGDNKAEEAIYQALHHPLLEIDTLDRAGGILVHFTGGDDLSLFEVGEAVDQLRDSLPDEADLLLGATTDPSMQGRAQVILIVTGLGASPVPAAAEAPAVAQLRISGPPVLDRSAVDLDLPAFLRRRATAG